MKIFRGVTGATISFQKCTAKKCVRKHEDGKIKYLTIRKPAVLETFTDEKGNIEKSIHFNLDYDKINSLTDYNNWWDNHNYDPQCDSETLESVQDLEE